MTAVRTGKYIIDLPDERLAADLAKGRDEARQITPAGIAERPPVRQNFLANRAGGRIEQIQRAAQPSSPAGKFKSGGRWHREVW